MNRIFFLFSVFSIPLLQGGMVWGVAAGNLLRAVSNAPLVVWD